MGLGLLIDERWGNRTPKIECPKCRSRDVVVEYSEGGYYKFYRCNECKAIREKEL